MFMDVDLVEEEIVIDESPIDEASIELNMTSTPFHKKHKKLKKHKKHKKRRNCDGDSHDTSSDVLPDEDDNSKKGVKLKLKLGGHTMGETSYSGGSNKVGPSGSPRSAGSGKVKKKGKGKGNDSEEEKWLDAIESGKLEEVDDELKRMRDPKLMTARQRAMFEKKSDAPTNSEQLMSLPSGYKEKPMTEEMMQKRALKSQKRKQLEVEKKEKEKKKTMDRLLRKQESKAAKLAKPKVTKKTAPKVIYRSNIKETLLSFPLGIQFPMEPKQAITLPPVKLCGIPGCTNLKKYACSRTGVPLCSLECYKKNFTSVRQDSDTSRIVSST